MIHTSFPSLVAEVHGLHRPVGVILEDGRLVGDEGLDVRSFENDIIELRQSADVERRSPCGAVAQDQVAEVGESREVEACHRSTFKIQGVNGGWVSPCHLLERGVVAEGYHR